MIDIGSTSFTINVPGLPRDEFEQYSTSLFDTWAADVESTLSISDFAISLEIEEGSIKGRGKIAVAVAALYLGIGQYGDFISGIHTIRGQVSTVSSGLFERARSPFGVSNVNAKVRRSGGALSRLETLFSKVQLRELTIDEAMSQAIALLGEEATSNPEFIAELKNQFENAPRYLEQIDLLGEFPEKAVDIQLEQKKPPKNRKPPNEIAIPQKFRIEIWRESKKEKRHVKVTNL